MPDFLDNLGLAGSSTTMFGNGLIDVDA